QIAANDGVIRIQARRDLEVAASFIEPAVADFREPETESGEGICLVERNRLLKGLSRLRGLDLRQIGEAKNGLCPRQIRLKCDRLLRVGQGFIQLAKRR